MCPPPGPSYPGEPSGAPGYNSTAPPPSRPHSWLPYLAGQVGFALYTGSPDFCLILEEELRSEAFAHYFALCFIYIYFFSMMCRCVLKPKDGSYEFQMLQEFNQAYQVHNLCTFIV